MNNHLKKCSARRDAARRQKRVGHSMSPSAVIKKNPEGEITLISSRSAISLSPKGRHSLNRGNSGGGGGSFSEGSFGSSGGGGGGGGRPPKPNSLGRSSGLDSFESEPPIATIGSDGRVSCTICQRKFAADRIAVHQRICRKVNTKEVEVFDISSQRTKEIKDQLPKSSKYSKKVPRGRKANLTGSATRFGGIGNGGVLPTEDAPKKKSNWREQHANFIANVRNAKKISKFMDAGGDARDIDKALNLTPAPAPTSMNMVDCPHCGRSFSELVAERHLPKCKNIINRPKPPKGAGFSLNRGGNRTYGAGNSRIGGQGGKFR